MQYHTTRLISGEKLWNSDKIRHLKPQHRAEYAWLLALADPNGNFELNLHSIHVHCYGVNRLETSYADVVSIIEDFKSNGLLFTWKENGHEFGHLTGIEELLPPPNHRRRYKTLKVTRVFTANDPDVLAYVAEAEARWRTNGNHARIPALIREERELQSPKIEQPERRCHCHDKTVSELIPIESWLEFVAMRKRIHAPLTDLAYCKLQLIRLHEDGQNLEVVLEDAVRDNSAEIKPHKNTPEEQAALRKAWDEWVEKQPLKEKLRHRPWRHSN